MNRTVTLLPSWFFSISLFLWSSLVWLPPLFFGRGAGSWPQGDIVLVVILALQGLLYLVFLFSRGERVSRITRTQVMIGTLLLSIPLLILPPVSSSDIYASGYYGQLVHEYGVSPFHVESGAIDDELFRATSASHPFETTYGPLWISFASVVTTITGGQVVPTALLFRLVNVAALMALVVALSAMLAEKPGQARLLALVAWNPLLVFEGIQNGHHDLIIAACIIGALAALQRRRWTTAFLLLVVGGLLKYVSFILPPLALAVMLRSSGPMRRKLRDLSVALAATVVAVFFSFLPYWEGWRTFRQLFALERFWAVPFYHPLALAGRIGEWFGASAAVAQRSAAQFGIAVFLISFLVLLWLVWRQRMPSPTAWTFAMLAFLLFGIAYVQPWYALWLLPLAPLLPTRARTLLLAVGTVLPLATYAVYASA